MATTFYTWDPLSDNVVMESDENGDTIATYSYRPEPYGKLMSQSRDGVTSTYHFDGLGNMSVLTDENENVTDTYEFSAFGEEISKTGSTVNPFGFQGAVGYYANPGADDLYVRARHYKPSVGRWMSPDPLWLAETSFSGYVYANSDPLNRVDPTGLLSVYARCKKVTGTAGFTNPSPVYTYIGVPYLTGLGRPPCPPGWTFDGWYKIPTTPEALIKNLCGVLASYPRCNKCTCEDLDRLLEWLKKAALATVPVKGTWDPCQRWCFGFEKALKGRHEFQGCLHEIDISFMHNFYAGHAVMRVVLCDGSVLYVDNQTVGGPDHIGLPSDVWWPLWGAQDLVCWTTIRQKPLKQPRPPMNPPPVVKPPLLRVT